MAGEMLRSQAGLSLLPGQLRVSHRVAPSLPCRTPLFCASSAGRQVSPRAAASDWLPARTELSAQAQVPSQASHAGGRPGPVSASSRAGSEPAVAQARQGQTRAASPARASSTRAAAAGASAPAQSSKARGAAPSPSQTQPRGNTGTGTGTGERSSLSAMASSNGWKLHCRRELQLQFPGTRESVGAYLAQPEQIVRVAFPDLSRLKQLGPTRWQARLKPVTFFHITATPVCTIRAWYEEDPSTGGRLRLTSESLKLEFIGAPAELTRVRLRLLLDGHLQPLGGSSPAVAPPHTGPSRTMPEAQAKQQRASAITALEGPVQAAGKATHAQTAGRRAAAGASLASGSASCLTGGCVDLGVVIEELPLALTFIPPAMASQVGSAILAAILDAMKGALQNGLVRDFSAWQQRQARGTPSCAPAAPTGTVPSTAAAAAGARASGLKPATGAAGAVVPRPSGVGLTALGGSAAQTGQ